ncbi:MAG: Hpt domain-containing protein, partial [Terracidiphilus sp.]
MKSATLLEGFVDFPELLDRVEGDQELLAELLALFQEDLPASRAGLQEAVARGELHEIERTAHALKGMLANLSAKHTAALAAEIESA